MRLSSALVAVVAVLAIHNVASNRMLPSGWYVPVNLATAGLLLWVCAMAAGGSPWVVEEAPGPEGVLVGVAAAAMVVAAACLPLAHPRWWRLAADRRMEGVTAAGTAYRSLVRIPLGTVVLEEVAFRAVLLELIARASNVEIAVVVSSLLFGVWHVLPGISMLETNGVEASVGRVLVIVAGGFLVGLLLCWLRIAGGTILASALPHLAVNSTSTVVAFAAHRRLTPLR